MADSLSNALKVSSNFSPVYTLVEYKMNRKLSRMTNQLLVIQIAAITDSLLNAFKI